MSEVSTSLSNSGSSGGGEIVRGDGNAPGQNPGEVMPSITTNERKGLDDFQRDMAEKNARARAGKQPQTAKTRIGAFSDALEKSQQAPVNPNEQRSQRQQVEERDEREPPEVKQLSETEPAALAVDDSNPSEIAEEGAPAEAISIDDKAALERYRQWEKDDMFPAELEAKLHEVKVSGLTRYVDTKELKQGYMRGGDYRRAFTDVQTREQAVARKDQAMQQHFEAIRDPEVMLEIYERNGYGPTLMKMAENLMARQQRWNQHIEGVGIAAMRALGMRQADWNHREVVAAMDQARADLTNAHEASIMKRQLEFEKQQNQQTVQQQREQQQHQERMRQYDNQLAQLRPNAFRAYGIPDGEGTRKALIRHLRDVFNTPEGAFKGEITRKHVMAAAESLRDERDKERAGERGLDIQNMRPQGGRPLPPNRIAAGGGTPMIGGERKQKSLDDLEAFVRRERGL